MAKTKKNIVKLLYFGDFHNQEKAPTSRTDNFQETCDNKAREILQIAKENRVAAILQPGDFLDKPVVNEATLKMIINRWFSGNLVAKNKIEQMLYNKTEELSVEEIKELQEYLSSSIPMVGVIGNHEKLGNSLINHPKTSLAFLEKLELMRLVDKEHPYIIKSGDKTLTITGSPYYLGIDETEDCHDYIIDKKQGDFHIHLVHGEATTQDFGSLYAHTRVDKFIKKTNADITLCGHDHLGFEPQTYEGRMVFNPGSILRLSASEKEINRTPEVLLFTIDMNKGTFDVETIQLKSAKNGTEVLSRDHITEKQDKAEKKEFFRELVESAELKKENSFKQILDEITQSEKIDEVIKNEIMKKVGDQLADKTRKVFADIPTFKSLECINFQSHRSSFFEFSEGVNVFTGETRSGKTSVLRAFDWIINNNPKNPRTLIHKNEEFAEVILTLSNGVKITRHVDRKPSGFNGYLVDCGNGEVEKLNTKGVSIIQDIVGYSELESTETKTVPLNFLKQGTSWFFIGDDVSGHDRARIIGSLYDTQVADLVQKELETENKKIKTINTAYEKDLTELEQKIKVIGHIDQLTKHIADLEKCSLELEVLSKELEEDKQLFNTLKKAKQSINILEDRVIDKLKGIDGLADNIRNTKELNEGVTINKNFLVFMKQLSEKGKRVALIKNKLEDVLIARNAVQQTINSHAEINTLTLNLNSLYRIKSGQQLVEKVISDLTPVLNQKTEIELLKALKTKIDRNAELVADLRIKDQKAKHLETIVSKLESVSKLRGVIDGINVDVKTITSYNEFKVGLTRNIEYQKQQGELLNEKKIILEKAITDKQLTLESLGVCPLCNQKIDSHHKHEGGNV